MSGNAIQRIIVTLHLSARPVHTTSVVNKQATHKVVLRVLWSSVSIITPMFHTLTAQIHQLPQQQHTKYQSSSIARSERDGTSAETRFRLSAKRTSPFKSARGGVSSVDYCAAEVCASAVVMLDTPCSEVV